METLSEWYGGDPPPVKGPYKLFMQHITPYGTADRRRVYKNHIARRVDHPMFGKCWTALCDRKGTCWRGELVGPLKVAGLFKRVQCHKCIKLAGRYGQYQEYQRDLRRGKVPISIDFTGAGEGGDYEVLEGGMYKATIEKIEQGNSRAGKPKLEWTFNLTDENNRKMWKNYSLQPNALWGLKADLTTLGFEIPDGPFELPIEDLIGMPVLLEISKKDHWNGETDSEGNVKQQNDVEKVLPDDNPGGW